MTLINIISFGYINGKPNINENDLLLGVRHMNNVNKKLRDKYDGTYGELQRELLEDMYNKKIYDDIIDQIFAKISGCNNLAELNIFVGCEKGIHRSVAVSICLSKDINSRFDNNINIFHRDLRGLIISKKRFTQNRSIERNLKLEFI